MKGQVPRVTSQWWSRLSAILVSSSIKWEDQVSIPWVVVRIKIGA